ncbi:MAG: hypothetical protein PHS14_19035, partial [Elusimicrobia bacterium]|nr:hypothetical protein [Elusimicrobiota bacterium]
DELIWLDDDDLPAISWPKGSKMYQALMPKLKRAPRGVARILQEYDAFHPNSVAAILIKSVAMGMMTLDQLEKVVIAYRRGMDFDMQGEDDTIKLPDETEEEAQLGEREANRDDLDAQDSAAEAEALDEDLAKDQANAEDEQRSEEEAESEDQLAADVKRPLPGTMLGEPLRTLLLRAANKCGRDTHLIMLDIEQDVTKEELRKAAWFLDW